MRKKKGSFIALLLLAIIVIFIICIATNGSYKDAICVIVDGKKYCTIEYDDLSCGTLCTDLQYKEKNDCLYWRFKTQTNHNWQEFSVENKKSVWEVIYL